MNNKEFYEMINENVTDEKLNQIKELDKDKLNLLKNMFLKNNKVLENIDLRILESKYINLFGEDKVNLICSYNDIQSEVLSLDDKTLNIFGKCINNYISANKTEDWTILAIELLESFKESNYMELIENIDDLNEIDIDKLTKIIQQKENYFEIKTADDIKNFKQKKQEKSQEVMYGKSDFQRKIEKTFKEPDEDIRTIIKEEGLAAKKECLYQKIFGMNTDFAISLSDRFGKDIDFIEDKDLVNIIHTIDLIRDTENEKVIQEIYEAVSDIEFANKTFIERQLKDEYAKLYNNDLYNPHENKKLTKKQLEGLKIENLNNELDGFDVYEAGTDFNILMTVVSPFTRNNIENYYSNWNRPSIDSQHFCTSYIRNDMIGTTKRTNISYGFSSIEKDSLVLSGTQDIYSTTNEFVSQSAYEEYRTPNNQINNTINYNEMDIKREINGVKKQPDYIIAFKNDKKIENLEEVKNAARDWEGRLPIVIVDVDKCMKSERGKIRKMLDEYAKTKDLNLAKKIQQKVRNNKQTKNSFIKQEIVIENKDKDKIDHHIISSQYEIDDDEIEQPPNEVEIDIEQSLINYKKLTPLERKEASEAIRRLRELEQSIEDTEKN